MTPDDFIQLIQNSAALIGGIMLVCVVLFILIIGLIFRRLSNLDIPHDADLTDTLQAVPFLLVVAIDILDLGLDFLAAPIVWIMLDRFGLRALRNVSAIEALIPFTNPIPTMTLAWLAVRLLGIRF
jgi:hypothetical protein